MFSNLCEVSRGFVQCIQWLIVPQKSSFFTTTVNHRCLTAVFAAIRRNTVHVYVA